jgi:thiamine biosynthesis protein ThiS
MTNIQNFFLNGQSYYIQGNITLLDLIHYFNFNDSLLVLEYNNLICDKKNWNQILIKDKDKIEIVTIVGGG